MRKANDRAILAFLSSRRSLDQALNAGAQEAQDGNTKGTRFCVLFVFCLVPLVLLMSDQEWAEFYCGHFEIRVALRLVPLNVP